MIAKFTKSIVLLFIAIGIGTIFWYFNSFHKHANEIDLVIEATKNEKVYLDQPTKYQLLQINKIIRRFGHPDFPRTLRGSLQISKAVELGEVIVPFLVKELESEHRNDRILYDMLIGENRDTNKMVVNKCVKALKLLAYSDNRILQYLINEVDDKNKFKQKKLLEIIEEPRKNKLFLDLKSSDFATRKAAKEQLLAMDDKAVRKLINDLLLLTPTFQMYNHRYSYKSKVKLNAEADAVQTLISMEQVLFPVLSEIFLSTSNDTLVGKILSIFGKSEIIPINPGAQVLYFFRKGTRREMTRTPSSNLQGQYYPELVQVGDLAIPYLLKLAKNKKIGTYNQYAISAVGELKSTSDEAYDGLLELLNIYTSKHKSTLRWSIYESLAMIHPEQRTKLLIKAIYDSDVEVRKNAVFALGNINPTTDEIISTLIEKFQHDSNPNVRLFSGGHILLIDKTSIKFKAALEKAIVNDPNKEVRQFAKYNLENVFHNQPVEVFSD